MTAHTPYGVVSEVLESNGSSSMANGLCRTMALMDAGVQLIKPVSGIAMGLISEGEKYAVLSDILGDEDHLGDMDFKVTGTADGITACQMDIKVKGLSYEILVNALMQQRMEDFIFWANLPMPSHNLIQTLKAHAPKMVTATLPNELIGAFIGPVVR
jgi:polyribonucleotide nucleotidyltransferase